MKIIEALKQGQDLSRKADDLRAKVSKHSAISSVQEPTYKDQKVVVAGWIQSYEDILKEMLRLRIAIQVTNLKTDVTIKLGDVQVTKNIAEWIHRRRDLASMQGAIYSALTDRNIIEGESRTAGSNDIVKVTIIRFYDPQTRDNQRELYTSEQSIIDGKLEIVNAVTDLIE